MCHIKVIRALEKRQADLLQVSKTQELVDGLSKFELQIRWTGQMGLAQVLEISIKS